MYKKLEHYLLIDDIHGVSVVTPPKTGSTTWRYTMLNSSGTLVVQKGGRMPDAYTMKAFSSVKSYVKLAEQVIQEDGQHALFEYCSVLTVRHPLDRLESSFRDQVIVHNQRFLKEAILIQKGYGALQAFRLAHSGYNIEFEDFLQYVLAHENNHWNSLYRLSSPCQVPYR